MSNLLLDRPLPSALGAERALLGGIMKNNSCMAEAVNLVKASDFSVSPHRIIFTHMGELWESGKPIEEVTLAHAMSAPDEIQKVGGVAYLTSLTDNVVKRDSVTHYAEIIREKARLRDLIHACDLGVSLGMVNDQPAAACVSRVQEALLMIEANIQKRSVAHIAQVSDEVFLGLEHLRAEIAGLPGLTTGIEALDLVTTGIRRGEFWVVGGRPGEGKSAIAIKAVLDNARRAVPVVLFTPEMDRHQVLTRLWAQYGRIPFEKLRNPKRLTDTEMKGLQQIMFEVAKLPIFIDDSSSIAIREIVARAKLLVSRDRLGLVVVDYIQLVDAAGRDERQRISAISNGLRALAKDGAPVLALSQLTRPQDKNLNRRPSKFDLKESGSLEADAHTVLLIFQPVSDANLPQPEQAEIIIAKQRNGPLGIEPVQFDGRHLFFRERHTAPE
jgi:replicative DNA helicase